MTAYQYSGSTYDGYFSISGIGHSVMMEDQARLGLLNVYHSTPGTGSIDMTLYDTARIDLLRVYNLDLNIEMNDSSRARMISHGYGTANIETSNKYVAYIETWHSDTVIVANGNVGNLDLGADTEGYEHDVTVNGYINVISVYNGETVLKINAYAQVGGASLGTGKDVVVIQENASANYIHTSGGKDKVTIKGSLDALHTGSGSDSVLLKGYLDSVRLGDGNDKVKLIGPDANFDEIRGGSGYDTIDASKSTVGVYIGDEGSEHQSARSIEKFIGSDFADIIFGGRGDDLINGGKGKDELQGGDGNDVLNGGRGGDFIVGGAGDDTLDGGAGNDELFGAYGADEFHFESGDGNDKIYNFETFDDTIVLESSDPSEDFASLGMSTSNGDLLVSYTDGSILFVEGEFLGLTSADFVFI